MKNTDEDRLGMFTKVAQFLQNNERALVTYLPDLRNSKQRLDTLISQIMDATAATNISSTGFTNIKANARERLVNNFLRLTRTLAAYAVIQNRPDLKANTSFSRSTVEKMRDNDLYIHAKMVIEFANPLIANLSALLYDATEYSEFLTSHLSFFSVIQLPKMQIGNRALRNVEVSKLMAQTATFLNEELDVLMGIIEYVDINIFDSYYSNRQIDHSGGRTASQTVSGQVLANSSIAIATVDYEPELEIELENTGNETLTLGISTDGDNFNGRTIDIAAAAIRKIKMEDLATMGDIIMIKNPSNRTVGYKLTVRD